jgi:hypothetical protein
MFDSQYSTKLYLDQWLKTSTKGNVVYEYSFNVDRLRFCCLVCDMTLTTLGSAVKNDGTTDYAVQEFIKIHSHVGGHDAWTPLTVPKVETPVTVTDHNRVLVRPTGRKFR